MRIIKKYSNRRLYDTGASQYITLDELASLIRDGHDVQVLDAKSNKDLTQATLAQTVIESRGAAKLLPTDLLVKLIRMENDALAEFMSTYVTWALDIYLPARDGLRGLKSNAEAENPLMRFFSLNPFFRTLQETTTSASTSAPPAPPEPHVPSTPPPQSTPEPIIEPEDPPQSDVETLRQEVNELKDLLRDLAAKR